MADILTLTFNPALDVFTTTARVAPEHKLRCDTPVVHPGGGGINVARVLQRLGADVLALFTAGGATGQRLGPLLDAEGVAWQAVPIAGETRESLSVHEGASGHDYRFVLPGPTLSPPEWEACLARVAAISPAPRYFVVSGSLPPGAPADLIERLAQLARERHMRLVMDSSGPALAAALAQGVHLVKPSLRELRELSGAPLATATEWLTAARRLVQDGSADIVALSLGAQGAMLVSRDAAWQAPALSVPVASTIGAGDSFLAGLLWALSRDADLAEALRQATAAGAAALLQSGTALSLAADIDRLYP